MPMVMISAQDRAQIAAILETHAEMQDQRTVQNLEMISDLNLSNGSDEETQTLVRDLIDQNDTFDGDCDNLRRLAKLFQ